MIQHKVSLHSFASAKHWYPLPTLLSGATLVLSFLLVATATADTAKPTPQALTSSKHMVAAANPSASEAGLQVLRRGGSALDAAVAVQMVLNLVEPESSGIGGGAFMLYWDADRQELVTYDGRETAPASATDRYFYDDNGEPMKWPAARPGGLSVGVPGTLKLLELAHVEHGKLPWASLMQPAIDLARQGFTVTDKLSASIGRSAEAGLLTAFDKAKNYFLDSNGQPPAPGSKLTNPEFADTLAMIASNGSTDFYHGKLAQEIVDTVNQSPINPGQMTIEDLANYRAIKREPICFAYRQYEVCGMGPPTSGALTMGQILTMLDQFDMRALGPTANGWHVFAEAAKLAYADRGLYMADADYVDMPDGLLDIDYLKGRASLIKTDSAMAKAEAGTPPWDSAHLFAPDTQPERAGTSHFVIVDANHNMVSMTTTIESGFGSGLMAGGFLLNNELTDFSLAAEKDGKPIANRVEGGKRPRSSMSPTIVFAESKPVLLTGSPGGSRIINYVTQSIVAMLDWDMDPQAAVAMGHVVNRNGATDLEENTEATQLQAGLEALGHEVKVRALNSGLHAIKIEGSTLTGGADPRRSGIVVGD